MARPTAPLPGSFGFGPQANPTAPTVQRPLHFEPTPPPLPAGLVEQLERLQRSTARDFGPGSIHITGTDGQTTELPKPALGGSPLLKFRDGLPVWSDTFEGDYTFSGDPTFSGTTTFSGSVALTDVDIAGSLTLDGWAAGSLGYTAAAEVWTELAGGISNADKILQLNGGGDAPQWSTWASLVGGFDSGITNTHVVYSASGVLSGSANFTLSNTAGDVYIARSLGIGVAAPGVSSALSIGAHGHTVAANDVAWGSAAGDNTCAWDDDAAHFMVGSSGAAGASLTTYGSIEATVNLRGSSLGVGTAASGNAGDIDAPNLSWDESLLSLGVAGTTPDVEYKVNVDWTSSSANTHAAGLFSTRANGAGSALGLSNSVLVNSGNANAITNVRGQNCQATHQGSNTVTNLEGGAFISTVEGTATNARGGFFSVVLGNASATSSVPAGGYFSAIASNYSGTLGALYGQYTLSQHTKAGGTNTLHFGTYVEAKSTAGTVTGVWGGRIGVNVDAGTHSLIYGVQGQVDIAGGTNTSAYGLHSRMFGAGGATNSYGLYITNTLTSGTKWGIFVNESLQSAINGSLAVGSTTAPTSTLDVTGDTYISSSLGVGVAATGTAGVATINTAMTIGSSATATTQDASLSVGAHAFTMAANDVAWGSSSAKRCAWDDSAGIFYIKGKLEGLSTDAAYDFQWRGNTNANFVIFDVSAETVGFGATPISTAKVLVDVDVDTSSSILNALNFDIDVTNNDTADYGVLGINGVVRRDGSQVETNTKGHRGADLSVFLSHTGTTVHASGARYEIRNLSSGTLTNGYGTWVVAPTNSGGGTFTNFYAHYIESATAATNNYGIYQAGTGMLNTFEGDLRSQSLGVGVAASGTQGEVTGHDGTGQAWNISTTAGGETVFNDRRLDIDLRVEGSSLNSLLHCNAGANAVIVGTSSTSGGAVFGTSRNITASATAYGQYNNASFSMGATAFNASGYGLFQNVSISGTGGGSGLIGGLRFQVTDSQSSGTITSLSGVNGLVQLAGAGSATNLFCFQATMTLSSTGNATNAYMYHAASPGTSSTGAITTLSQYYAADVTDDDITTKIAFHQVGTNAHNRLNGNTMIGADSAPATSAVLELSSTTGALLVPRMTTTQRNALTAVNGMIIYNSTTGAFNFYEGGAWVTGSGLT